jgi:outer membrane protein OmpA-like peptidoglycan-associated protein
MRNLNKGLLPLFLGACLSVASCGVFTKTQKGAAIGTATGAGVGAVIGRTAGNTALGAIIGATVGGTAGALIGNKMDKQAEEIKKNVPDAEVIRVGEGIVVEFNSAVLFGFDKSSLSNEAKSNLDKLVVVLKNNPDTNIEVQGHTDSKGSVAYNQTLSEERATSAAGYLLNRGISHTRLSTNSFGEMLPKYVNNTEVGRDKNRRVEFLITANEQMRKDADKAILGH